ncbi:hypothetical protein ACIA76_43565, partial [Nocardia sp. NPDC051570]
ALDTREPRSAASHTPTHTSRIEVLQRPVESVLTFTDDEFEHAIQDETGVKPAWAAEAFGDLNEDVRQSIRRIAASPFVTATTSLRGFVFDIATGKLDEVTF